MFHFASFEIFFGKVSVCLILGVFGFLGAVGAFWASDFFGTRCAKWFLADSERWARWPGLSGCLESVWFEKEELFGLVLPTSGEVLCLALLVWAFWGLAFIFSRLLEGQVLQLLAVGRIQGSLSEKIIES